MARLTRNLVLSAALGAAISLVLIGMQVRPAAAQSCDSEVCPTPTPTSTYTPSPTPICNSDNPCPTPTPSASPSPTPSPSPTGADSSGGSINDLAKQRFNQMITNRVLGTVLLGVNEQVNYRDCISAFGSAGSFSAAIHGRKELTPTLSLLAGIAFTQYSE